MRKFCAWAAAALILTGCHTVEPDLTAYTSGPAEVPLEILGGMDEDTREELTGEPKYAALTFDDGPRPGTTDRLLDGLLERDAAATFFVIGEQVRGNEALLRRMAAEGHQIGIHTYDHVDLKGLSRRDFDLQVGKTRALLTGLLGEGSYWLRPPYGLIDDSARLWCGGPVILWSVDPEDWRDKDVDRIVSAVAEHVSDGDIILLHDLFPTSVQAALRIVDALLAKGYCFVTVEQLMAERGAAPETGQYCRKFPPAEK